jgi:hypothetical protein
MASDFGHPSASMEGRGSYNRHSLIPPGGGALAFPHLERAIADVPLGPIDQPVVIVDYGSSQGLNSLAPMRLAIESVRQRSSAVRPILVYHVDQLSNDFNSPITDYSRRLSLPTRLATTSPMASATCTASGPELT